MVLESRMTWEKLCLELDLLVKEDPKSLIPLLIGVDSILRGNRSPEACGRAVNFMAYELNTQCDNMSEADRLNALNEFFFKQRDFQISSINSNEHQSIAMLFQSVVENRKGTSLTLAALYTYLGHQAGLLLSIVDIPNFYIIKWTRGSRAYYVSLMEHGKILDEAEVLNMVNQHQGSTNCLNALHYITVYLEDLSNCFHREGEYDAEHAALSMLLHIEPNSLKYLSTRAFVRKNLGHGKEALADLKRYFSFTDQEHAPHEIIQCYNELMALQNTEPNSSMLH